MKRNHLFGIAASLMLSGAAYADSYQYEVGADFAYWDQGGDHVDSDYSYGLHGAAHFSPVNTDGLPLAEAAFLNRSSNVRLGVSEDARRVFLGAEYYVPNTMLYVNAVVSRARLPQGSDTNWGMVLGVTPIDGLRVSTSVGEDSYNPNINAKYVMPIGERRALNIETYYTQNDGFDDHWGLAGDFYFTPRFSLGAAYDDAGNGRSQESIRTRMFFTPAVSGELAYANNDLQDRIWASVVLRF